MLLYTNSTSAMPTVIQDYGNGKPIGWILKDKQNVSAVPGKPKDYLAVSYPVTSVITLGRIQPKALPPEIRSRIVNPIFVIGDDAQSMKWFSNNKRHLVKIKAKGILVTAKDGHNVKNIKRVVSPLQIELIPADDFLFQLGVNHFPALISSEGITQ